MTTKSLNWKADVQKAGFEYSFGDYSILSMR